LGGIVISGGGIESGVLSVEKPRVLNNKAVKHTALGSHSRIFVVPE
jgi:hypothetical protein